jgi:hypothetical protein
VIGVEVIVMYSVGSQEFPDLTQCLQGILEQDNNLVIGVEVIVMYSVGSQEFPDLDVLAKGVC